MVGRTDFLPTFLTNQFFFSRFFFNGKKKVIYTYQTILLSPTFYVVVGQFCFATRFWTPHLNNISFTVQFGFNMSFDTSRTGTIMLAVGWDFLNFWIVFATNTAFLFFFRHYGLLLFSRIRWHRNTNTS